MSGFANSMVSNEIRTGIERIVALLTTGSASVDRFGTSLNMRDALLACCSMDMAQREFMALVEKEKKRQSSLLLIDQIASRSLGGAL